MPLLNESLGVPEKLGRISASSMSTIQTCRRKYALRSRCGLSTKDYSSARETGTISHAYLQALYKGLSRKEALEAADAAKHQLVRELQDLPGAKAGLDIEVDLTRDMLLAIIMCDVWWEKFGWDTNRWKVVTCEEEMTVPWSPDDKLGKVDIIGFIDLLVEDTETGELWIVDIKTTSDDPVKRQATASYDPQSRIYRLLAEAWSAKNGGKPVVGIMYPTLVRPTITCKKMWAPPPELGLPPPAEGRKTRAQTPDEYYNEVRRWYAGTGEHEGTTTGGSHALVPPCPMRFEGPTIDDEFGAQLWEGYRMAVTPLSPSEFYRTPDTYTCRGRKGTSGCEYLPICSSSPLLWPTISKQLYQTETT